jgi:polysaccharide biosynthesis protein PslH
VRQEMPTARLEIVGRRPSPKVQSLARRHAGVNVVGTVPDVRPYHERAAVFVVPLRIGGGTRLKIFEAMAMERPVVSTTVGAEGLDVRNGEHLLIADTPEAFASAVVRLLRDPEEAAALGKRAAAHVRDRFGWQQVASQFADICADVLDAASQKHPASTVRV